jgi:hypothetical protein
VGFLASQQKGKSVRYCAPAARRLKLAHERQRTCYEAVAWGEKRLWTALDAEAFAQIVEGKKVEVVGGGFGTWLSKPIEVRLLQ